MSKERFHEQIEAVLDANIKKLTTLDQERTEAVSRLKQTILDELRQGSKLDDARLERQEVTNIFKALFLNDELRPIFDRYEIRSYEDIDTFLNSFLFSGMEFVDLKLFGHDVKLDYEFPVDTSMYPHFIASLKACMAFLETRPDFRELITPKTRFTAIDYYRMSFEVEKNGEKKTYVVFPNGILLVQEEKPLSQLSEEGPSVFVFVQRIKNVIRNDFSVSMQLMTEGVFPLSLVDPTMTREDQHLVVEYAKTHSRRVMRDESTGQMVFDLTTHGGDSMIVFIDGNGMLRRVVGEIGAGILDVFFNERGGKSRYTCRDPKSEKRTFADFDDNGMLSGGEMYGSDGLPRFKFSRGSRFVYDDNGQRKYRYGLEEKSKRYNAMYFPDGSSLGSFLYERVKSKQKSGRYMTEEKYMNTLVQKLDNPEKLALFFQLFMKYEFDNPVRHAAKKARNGSPKKDRNSLDVAADLTEPFLDRWQPWDETLRRADDQGTMMGDCEDYSFLAREILRRQGKNAHVISYLHKESGEFHAICVWIDQDSGGNFMAQSFSTEGLRWGRKRPDTTSEQDEEKKKKEKSEGLFNSGKYATAAEAMEDLLERKDALVFGKRVFVIDLDKYEKVALKDYDIKNIDELFPER